MPHTINGIGTWYWGKRNILTRDAACEFCGSYRQLSSYDTTLYFTVLYIPLVPLGRKRVVNQCPGCTRHRAIPLKKWEAQKTESLMAAISAWQQDKSSAEKAKQAMGVAIGFQDMTAFDDVAAAASQQFARDPEMQLFLGEAYDHFGRPEMADACYQRAIGLRNDDDTRYGYAAYLIRRIRPADAKPLLDDVVPQRKRDRAPLVLALAQAYQAVGAHEPAAQLIDELGTAFPDLLSDANFERVRKTSAKYRGTNKKVAVAGLGGKGSGFRRENWFQRHGAKSLVATIIVVAAAWYLIAASQLGHHTVQVVNGTPASYVVDIDGTRRSIPALSSIALPLDEGDYTVKVVDHPEVEPAAVGLHTNFWKRPFNRKTFVINPDRTALVYSEVVRYTDNQSGGKGSRPPTQMYFGQPVYEIDKGDDVFQQPPSSVTSEHDVSRRHIDMVRKLPTASLAALIKGRFGRPAAADFMKRRALMSGDDFETTALLVAFLDHDEQLGFLRDHLADRPVRVELHRVYQQVAEAHRPDHDLVAEYKAMLDKEPGNAALTYLLARVTEPPAVAQPLFRKAAEANPPCAHALYALSADAFRDGDFARALEQVRAARKLNPNHPQFVTAEADALEAMGDTAGYLALVRSRETHDGRDLGFVADEARMLVRTGQAEQAKQRCELFVSEFSRTLSSDPDAISETRAWLDSGVAYAKGDLAAFEAALKDLKDPDAKFRVAVTRGDVAAAESALKESEEGGAGDETGPLILAVAAANAHNQSIAERAWGLAIERMKHGTRTDRAVAAAVEKGQPPSDEMLRAWAGQPAQRCLLYTALGTKFPQRRDAYFAAARKFNYANVFPQRLLAAAMDAK
jgi:tetratricopeptide (TPR) repeat protein